MKKIVFTLYLLFIFIINLKAEVCSSKEVQKYSLIASNITYKTEFNRETNKFNIVFYNVKDPYLFLKISDDYKTYNYLTDGYDDEYIHINNLSEGESLVVTVNLYNMECNQPITSMYIHLPYYNPHYNTGKCKQYKGVLTVCSEEFLPIYVNSAMFDEMIDNYNSKYNETEEEIETIERISIIKIIKDFLLDYGIKMMLSITTIIVCTIIYRIKVRKIKHGI